MTARGPRALFDAGAPGPPAARPKPIFAAQAPAPASPVPVARPRPLVGGAPSIPDNALVQLCIAAGRGPAGTLPVAQRMLAGLMASRPDDASAVDGLGADAQARAAALPDALLDLAAEPDQGLLESLGRIGEAVRSVDARSILAAGLLAGLRRHLDPPAARMDAAVAVLTAEAAAAARAIPAMRARLARVDALVAEEAEVRRDFSAALAAARVFRHHAFIEDGADPRLPILEERTASLALAMAANEGLGAHLAVLRAHTARLIGAAAGEVPMLVGVWKQQCAAAITRLRADGGAPLGRAMGGLAATGDRLTEAIRAANSPGRRPG